MTKTTTSSDARQLPRGSAAPGTAPWTVTGTLSDGTGAVAGTFDVTDIVDGGTTARVVGTFTGTVTNAFGSVTTGTQGLELEAERDGAGMWRPQSGAMSLVLLGWDVSVTESQADRPAGAQPRAGVQ